ncbi:LNR domain protein [Pelomyxa schiedti]|nr:LNR domain protein [Pelomyxa schiedti]
MRSSGVTPNRLFVVAWVLILRTVFANEGWSDDCAYYNVGDGNCDIECYSATNNFDSGDCDGLCNAGCLASDPGNGICDPWCMTEACNYDNGDCGTSACGNWTCTGDLSDGICDLQCATSACAWDNGDCFYLNCAPGCDPANVGDAMCDWACNTAECDFDQSDCARSCAPGCFTDDIGDESCDTACYNEDCSWDSGDCDTELTGNCYFGCPQAKVGDGTCDSYCYNEPCNWDGGDCDTTYCGEAGCYVSNLGDSSCDAYCNNAACNFDDGDCTFNYAYVEISFADDNCTGDVLSANAIYYAEATNGYCWFYSPTIQCGTGNQGQACFTTADLQTHVNAWFDEEPAHIVTWANPDCKGTPWTVTYISNDACTLINNNLWGYSQWADKGVLVQWVCTDSNCTDCFVQPDGVGIDSYYLGCSSDGYGSAQAFTGAIIQPSSGSSESNPRSRSESLSGAPLVTTATSLLISLFTFFL